MDEMKIKENSNLKLSSKISSNSCDNNSKVKY